MPIPGQRGTAIDTADEGWTLWCRSPSRHDSESLSADLVDVLDARVESAQTNRSTLLTELFEAVKQRRIDWDLAETYDGAVAEGIGDDI